METLERLQHCNDLADRLIARAERAEAELKDARYLVDAARHDHAETRRLARAAMQPGLVGIGAMRDLVARLRAYDEAP